MLWAALFQYMLPWRWLQGLQHPFPWVTTPGREWLWPNSRWRTSTATWLYSTRRGKPGTASSASHPSAAVLALRSRLLQSPGMGQLWEVFVCGGREWIPRGHKLSFGGPVNIAVTEWSRSSTCDVFMEFYLFISYFVEAALCRVLFCSACEVSSPVWGWWPRIPLCVPQGMSSAELLRGGSLVWGKAGACGVCTCSAPWNSCQDPQTLQEGVYRRWGMGLRGVWWGDGVRKGGRELAWKLGAAKK